MQRLKQELATTSAQCAQLDEACRAWQLYQYNQAETFRQTLQPKIPSFAQIEHPSLEILAEHIGHFTDQLRNESAALAHQIETLKNEILSQKRRLGLFLRVFLLGEADVIYRSLQNCLDTPSPFESERRGIQRQTREKNILDVSIFIARVYSTTIRLSL